MKRYSLIISIFVISFILFPYDHSMAAMGDYCQIPPYVKREVPPNIMVLMDNSLDMRNAAYSDNYDAAKTYLGYFDPNKMYSYGSNEFTEDVAGTLNGNLLNWATMSRYDILQKVLIGGFSFSSQGNAHTLGSVSGSWSKTDGGCTYTVNNADLTISGAGCGGGPVGVGPCPTPLSNPASFPASTGAGKSNKTPSILTNSIPDGELNTCYSFNFQAKWGKPDPTATYTWSVPPLSLPAGLSLDSASGIIYGKPTATGTTNFTVTVTDANGDTDSEDFSLTVGTAAVGGSSSYTIKLAFTEEPLTDINGNDAYDSDVAGESFVDQNGNGKWDGKKGVFHEFWDELNPRARWGLTNWTQQGDVNVTQCIPPNNTASFYNDVQTNTSADTSPLSDGLYGITNYIMDGNHSNYDSDSHSASGCSDPLDDVPCRLTFALMLTSGSDVSGDTFNLHPSDPCDNMAKPLVQTACFAANNDLRTDKGGKQYISTYVVQTFGAENSILKEAANEGNGNYYSADTNDLEQQIRQALQDILKRAASGTAASVLASGEGKGATLMQAVFYPRRKFENDDTGSDDEISWTGRLASFWYYLDPHFTNSGVRENTVAETTPLLSLSQDKMVRLYYDPNEEVTKAKLCSDTNGDGGCDGNNWGNEKSFEELSHIWEAGERLFAKSPTERRIFTTVDGKALLDSDSSKGGFDNVAHATTLMDYLNVTTVAEAEKVIRYVRGEDDLDNDGFPDLGLRSRTVFHNNTKGVWKLGDIINSTPKISSWSPLNRYHKVYRDLSYGPSGDPFQSDPVNENHYITKSDYKNRGMVYVGGNDGMLHAFKLGTLQLKWGQDPSTGKVAKLTGSDLGEESWAFIPRNVLPYLKYQSDPNYCHIYTVDLTPYIFDASINADADLAKTASSWKTILIGGMRRGGACRDIDDTTCTECVKTPIDDVGYSSYFALDITNENEPELMWEFPNEDTTDEVREKLGFATTGPAVVRIGDKYENGEWFVVFGSGPTGPIESSGHQFMGHSDQNLRLFVLDLRSGDVKDVKETNVTNAFSGTLKDATNDTDHDYQDDSLYVGFVKKGEASGEWDQGGIGRLLTYEDPDPVQWDWSIVMDNIGPVTSGVSRLLHKDRYTRNKTLWLYFGTGRYYFDTETEHDDEAGQRHIYGIKDKCMEIDGTWKETCPSITGLKDVTLVDNAPERAEAAKDTFSGWYINLDPKDDYPYYEGEPLQLITRNYFSERVVTAPLASTNGCVFFTSFKPYDEECSIAGKSFLWVVDYSTGGKPECSGKLTFQVSTGSIEEVEIPEDKDSSDSPLQDGGGRKTSAIEGEPSSEASPLQTLPKPFDRVLHRRVQ